MALPDVTPQDVDLRYEGDAIAEYGTPYLTTQIQDAVDKATARWGARIQARLTSGALTENLYKRAISNAVLRVARNPEGFTTENDGTYGYGKRADVASGVLGFSDEDIADLIGLPSSNVPGTILIGLDRRWRP